MSFRWASPKTIHRTIKIRCQSRIPIQMYPQFLKFFLLIRSRFSPQVIHGCMEIFQLNERHTQKNYVFPYHFASLHSPGPCIFGYTGIGSDFSSRSHTTQTTAPNANSFFGRRFSFRVLFVLAGVNTIGVQRVRLTGTRQRHTQKTTNTARWKVEPINQTRVCGGLFTGRIASPCNAMHCNCL